MRLTALLASHGYQSQSVYSHTSIPLNGKGAYLVHVVSHVAVY